MATVKPFRGIRYNVEKIGNLSKVVAPPYDVISQADQEIYYARHPYNIIRLILGKDLPNDDHQNNKYTRASAYLQQWLEEDVLIKDKHPAFYICEDTYISPVGTQVDSSLLKVEANSRKRKSLIARVKLEEWGEGSIYPHEETMPGPKQDRLRLMRACKANLSSILALYPDEERKVEQFLDANTPNNPIAKVCDNDVSSTLWKIDNPDVTKQICKLMADQPLFIADGHHRYETALNYMKEVESVRSEGIDANFVMMTCVSMNDPGLEILPTHRLIRGVPDIRIEMLKQKLSKYFEIIPLSYDYDGEASITNHLLRVMERLSTHHENKEGTPRLSSSDPSKQKRDSKVAVFGLYCGEGSEGQRYFILRLKPTVQIQNIIAPNSDTDHSSIQPTWQNLDVNLLHSLILPLIFATPSSANIDTNREPIDSKLIGYTRDPEFVIKSVDTGDYQLGFFLNPTLISELRNVAMCGGKMPSKSTYFYPKLFSGLVINQISKM